MASSNSTDPQVEGYGAQDWITILHNAATRGNQAMAQRALVNLGVLNQTQNKADMTQAGQDLSGGVKALASMVPGGSAVASLVPDQTLSTLGAGAVGFGQGASLGGVQPPVVGGQSPIKMAHGTAVNVGDAMGNTTLGTAATLATGGLSPVLAGGLVGGGLGAGRGFIGTAVAKEKGETNPGMTGDPKVDGLLGGLLGSLTGMAGGRLLGGKVKPTDITGIVPGMRQVGRNLTSLFTKQAAQEGAQLAPGQAEDMAEATLRRFVSSQPVFENGSLRPRTAEEVERAMVGARQELAKGTVKEGTFPNLTPTGVRNPPDPMDVPTYLRRAAQSQPITSGSGTTITPDETSAPPRVAEGLRAAAVQKGAPLTEAERDAVLSKALPNSPRPGHPIFSGDQSFTRSPEVRGGEPLNPSASPNTQQSTQASQQLAAMNQNHAMNQAQMLLNAPQEQFDAAKDMVPPDVHAQIGQMRQQRMSQQLQQATGIAQQVAQAPGIARAWPTFAGKDPAAIAQQIHKMLVSRIQDGGTIPPLNSLAQFLADLHAH